MYNEYKKEISHVFRNKQTWKTSEHTFEYININKVINEITSHLNLLIVNGVSVETCYLFLSEELDKHKKSQMVRQK